MAVDTSRQETSPEVKGNHEDYIPFGGLYFLLLGLPSCFFTPS